MVRGQGRKNAKPGTFGTVHRLNSGRYRALYTGPDGRRHKAPTTFTTIQDARGWLSVQQADIIRKAWSPPEAIPAAKGTFTDYSKRWMARRQLKDRTREHYDKLLDDRIKPTFGTLPIAAITAEDVEKWHANEAARNKPTMTAHAYSLLNTVMNDAVKDRVIPFNPCVIRGAGYAKRAKRIKPATLDELAIIVENSPERYKLMVLLAAWCALRFGELTALTRADVTLGRNADGGLVTGSVEVSKGVVRAGKERKVTTPKSDAGDRTVAIPPHLLPIVDAHLAEHVAKAPSALLFPAVSGSYLAPGAFYRGYYKAREAAGRDDLRFHDLRHTGAVLAASTGATLAELMNRLGHSSPAAALRYQHVVDGRDREVAAMLSELAKPKPKSD